MKLFRFEKNGAIGIGVLTENGKHLDISSFGQDLNEDFLSHGGLQKLSDWLSSNAG